MESSVQPEGNPPADSSPEAAPTRRRMSLPLLTILRWTAIVAVLVVALIGFLYLTRGTAVKHVRGVGADGTPVAPAEAEFPLSVAMLTGTVLTTGNRVEIALNGDGTFPRLWDDLRSAQRSITVQMYYGQPGQVGETLIGILLDRARAGVRVMFLYDAFGTQGLSDERVKEMRAAGIMTHPFRPLRLSNLYVIQNRSHVRGIVIDGRIGWTGGFGIDDKWMGDGRTRGSWRETNARFEGPAVRQLQAVFAAAWTEATGVLLSGRMSLERHEGGVATAGLLYGAPTAGSTSAERFMALSIAGARKSMYITNAYFVPDDSFVQLIIDAARRGVDVRLLVAGPRTDIALTRRAGRKRYAALLAAGVRIYEWAPTTLHAKTFVIDGTWSSIGTLNFDNRSLALNDEVALMVLDVDFGRRMEAIFLDDLTHALEIDPAVFADRSWLERVREWGASLLTPVL